MQQAIIAVKSFECLLDTAGGYETSLVCGSLQKSMNSFLLFLPLLLNLAETIHLFINPELRASSYTNLE